MFLTKLMCHRSWIFIRRKPWNVGNPVFHGFFRLLPLCQHANFQMLLSLFAGLKYNEVAAASTTKKGMTVMAEFGENLKRVREEKGLTQQTLADNLYVTRQAVSRWEGGSRYPDLMTAKKMAQFLEVSLDDLLTDDDMKLYAEKNAILESATAKRGQLILLSLAFMSLLFLSIVQLTNFYFEEGDVLAYSSETPKYFLLTILLGVSLVYALLDRINAKTALLIYGSYFGISLLLGLRNIAFLSVAPSAGPLAINLVMNLCCLLLCVLFFAGKKRMSPVPVYIATGVYAIVGIYFSFVAIFSEVPTHIHRNMLMENIFALLENLIMLALLVVMTYTLHRKRKLSMK